MRSRESSLASSLKCECWDGEWRELAQGDPSGPAVNWAAGRWVAYAGGWARAGASTVTLRHDDRTRECPVVEGLYVGAFWSPPGDRETDPPNPPTVVDG